MKAGEALVLTADPRAAAHQAAVQATAALDGASPSLAVLFASAHFFGSAAAVVAAVSEEIGPVPLIGCVTDGVAGGGREIESEPAVSLWLAADLGPVQTFAMEFVQTQSAGAFGGFRFGPGPSGMHLMICDPFTFPVGDLLAHLNQNVPGAMVMGGMASGGAARRQSRLFLDGVIQGDRAAPPVRRADDPHPGPVHLPREDEIAGPGAEGGREPPPVLQYPGRFVTDAQAQVQGGVRARGDPAAAGRDRRVRT